jgi:phosphatidylglycerol:prolipoprotein diacylglycerol transferase
MHPFVEIFGLKIPAYGIMLLLALFTAYMAVAYFSRRENLPFEKLESLFFWVFVAALVGARLFYAAEHFIFEGKGPFFPAVFEVWKGGLDFFGGAIFATITLLLGIRFYKLPFWKTVDVAGISVLLAHSVGRLSCWLAGCCYGKPTDLPIGVVFPPGAVAPSGIPLYPTQVMEATGNFIGFLLLYWLYRRKPFDGFIGASYLVYYGAERFLLEFLRGTTPPIPGLGLTWNQVVCLIAISVGLAVIALRFRTARG